MTSVFQKKKKTTQSMQHNKWPGRTRKFCLLPDWLWNQSGAEFVKLHPLIPFEKKNEHKNDFWQWNRVQTDDIQAHWIVPSFNLRNEIKYDPKNIYCLL